MSNIFKKYKLILHFQLIHCR